MQGKVCTFFGHRDCPQSIRPKLRAALIEQIETQHVTTFLVGNEGGFDAMAQSVLHELRQVYPTISCTVVLAYLPRRPQNADLATLFPEGIETVPKRFAISWRNRWMLRHADCVIAYVAHSWAAGRDSIPISQLVSSRPPGSPTRMPMPVSSRVSLFT